METREELEAEYERAVKGVATWQMHVEDLAKKLGRAAPSSVTSPTERHKEEDEAISTFERMTSAELMELYQTDKARWKQVMDGVQSAGERKLAKLNGR